MSLRSLLPRTLKARFILAFSVVITAQVSVQVYSSFVFGVTHDISAAARTLTGQGERFLAAKALLVRELAGQDSGGALPALMLEIGAVDDALVRGEPNDRVPANAAKLPPAARQALEQLAPHRSAWLGHVSSVSSLIRARDVGFASAIDACGPILVQFTSIERGLNRASDGEYYLEVLEESRQTTAGLRGDLYRLHHLSGEEQDQVSYNVDLLTARLQEQLLAMRDGSDDYELDPVDDDSAREALGVAIDHWATLAAEVKGAMEAKSALTVALQAVDEMEPGLLGDQRGLAQAAAAVAETKFARFQQVQRIFSGVLLLTLAAVFAMTLSLCGALRRLGGMIAGIAQGEGDLTQRLEHDRQDEVGDIAQYLNAFLTDLEGIIREVRGSALEIDSINGSLHSTSRGLSGASGKQVDALHTCKDSVQQISAQAEQSSKVATEVSGLADAARRSAEDGSSSIAKMRTAVEEMSQGTRDVEDIAKVIDSIAFQTNLLALNAAVEAARAGDAGKGFSVVAEEVRSLAQRSGDAAHNITTKLEGFVGRADTAMVVTMDVVAELDSILESTGKVSDLVGSVAQASETQRSGVADILLAVEEIDQLSVQAARTSDELAAISVQAKAGSTSVREHVQRFRVSEN